MSAAKYSYSALNTTQAIPDLAEPCAITTPAGTDIYDKPPSTHRFDAPIFHTTIRKSSFRSVSTSVTAPWTQRYDQGGLIIFFDNPRTNTRKWIKTGIEFLEGVARISVVTKDNWADWSLSPLVAPNSTGEEGGAKAQVMFEVGSEDGALWVFVVDGSGNKVPVREVTWWEDVGDEVEISVGPYVAKPSSEGGELTVKFEGYELKTI